MATALGMTRDALSNRVYERRGQAVRTQHSMEMQQFTGTTLFAQAIATLSGGVFVPLIEPGSVDREDLHSKFQELWSRLGELSRAYTEYTQDNHIDPREKADLQRISNEIHRTMQELMALMFQIYCQPDGRGPSPEVRRA